MPGAVDVGGFAKGSAARNRTPRLADGPMTGPVGARSVSALTGIVSQDTVLFNDTVRSNIAYGANGKYSQEQIEKAARAAATELAVKI